MEMGYGTRTYDEVFRKRPRKIINWLTPEQFAKNDEVMLYSLEHDDESILVRYKDRVRRGDLSVFDTPVEKI